MKNDALQKANEVIKQLDTKVKIADKRIKSLDKEIEARDKYISQVDEIKSLVPTPPEWIGHTPPKELPGVPMTMWSDWHWGEKVDPSQIGGKNKFNHAIAAKRVKRLVDNTLDLTLHHMVRPQYPGIVICLGGDMITGAIHEDLAQSNEGPVLASLLDVQENLITAISTMSDNFEQVFIPCVVGNHGRNTLKPRAKDRVKTSLEWFMYLQVAKHFDQDRYGGRVKFFIPNEADARFTVNGHSFLLTHGDAIAGKGGDGIIGAIGPIARGAQKIIRSTTPRPDTIIIGHYHTYIPRGDALPVVANGSLIGHNEYAELMLRVPASRPTQALWFMHRKHGFTAQWPVYLDDQKQEQRATEWLTFNQMRAA